MGDARSWPMADIHEVRNLHEEPPERSLASACALPGLPGLRDKELPWVAAGTTHTPACRPPVFLRRGTGWMRRAPATATAPESLPLAAPSPIGPPPRTALRPRQVPQPSTSRWGRRPRRRRAGPLRPQASLSPSQEVRCKAWRGSCDAWCGVVAPSAVADSRAGPGPQAGLGWGVVMRAGPRALAVMVARAATMGLHPALHRRSAMQGAVTDRHSVAGKRRHSARAVGWDPAMGWGGSGGCCHALLR